MSAREKLWLGSILALALAVRVAHLQRDSLWMDELFSMAQSGGYSAWAALPPSNRVSPLARTTSLDGARPVAQILTELRDDNHPPLHFLLLRAWREAFGDGAAVVRSLSILFSLASLLLLFDAVRQLEGVEGALWATLLASLAGPHVYYARETRSYALLLFFLLGAAAAAARLQAQGPSLWRALALGACALGACLSHYGGLGFLLGLFAWVAVSRFDRGGRREAVLAFFGAALVFLVLWGPTLWLQLHAFGPNNAWNSDDPDDAATVWTRLLPLPLQVVFTSGPFFAARPASLGLVWPVLAWLAWWRPSVRLWALVGLGSIGYAAAVDIAWGSAQLQFSRYVLPATPALCAMIAGARFGSGALRHLAPTGAAALLALVLPMVWQPQRPPWREWGELFQPLAPGDDVIVVWQPGALRKGTFLLLQTYAWSPDRRVMMLDPPLDEEGRAALSKRFWLVSSRRDPSSAVPQARFEERVEMRLPQAPRVFEGRLD